MKPWRTRRMAWRKRNVYDLPYAALPLSCAAFFVKEQKAGYVSKRIFSDLTLLV
jgi:hypothetical protein